MFLMQSACVLDVARTLGSSRLGAFLQIALPLARPAIAVGVALALMEAMNDIGAVEYLGVRTLTVSIYTTWLSRGSLERRGADRAGRARRDLRRSSGSSVSPAAASAMPPRLSGRRRLCPCG